MAPDDGPDQGLSAGGGRRQLGLAARADPHLDRAARRGPWLDPRCVRHGGALPPWQQDYFASTAAAAARRGGEDARAVLAWMANFLVGRFRAEGKGFARNDGAAYLLAIAPEASPRGPPLRSWAEIAEATRARGMSNGEGWAKSQGDYPRLAQQTLAQIVDVLGSQEARDAHAWLIAADAPTARPAFFARNPSLNIVPRGMRRVPARASAGCCATAGAARG